MCPTIAQASSPSPGQGIQGRGPRRHRKLAARIECGKATRSLRTSKKGSTRLAAWAAARTASRSPMSSGMKVCTRQPPLPSRTYRGLKAMYMPTFGNV